MPDLLWRETAYYQDLTHHFRVLFLINDTCNTRETHTCTHAQANCTDFVWSSAPMKRQLFNVPIMHTCLYDTNVSYSPFILLSDAEGEEEEGEGNTAFLTFISVGMPYSLRFSVMNSALKS